ncbi:MAG: hypothetical protein LC745_07785 [Planctomycetia bacterium]|nr:hypothetical protein [Planctomycetia bacterium]
MKRCPLEKALWDSRGPLSWFALADLCEERGEADRAALIRLVAEFGSRSVPVMVRLIRTRPGKGRTCLPFGGLCLEFDRTPRAVLVTLRDREIKYRWMFRATSLECLVPDLASKPGESVDWDKPTDAQFRSLRNQFIKIANRLADWGAAS